MAAISNNTWRHAEEPNVGFSDAPLLLPGSLAWMDYAGEQIQNDSPDAIAVRIQEAPEQTKKSAVELLLTIWAEHGCPPKCGDMLTQHSLFAETDLRSLLDRDGILTLGEAFLHKNHKAYIQLQRHPHAHLLITADSIVAAFQYVHQRNVPDEFCSSLVNALGKMLPCNLQSQVANHLGLPIRFRAPLIAFLDRRNWAVFIRGLANVNRSRKELSSNTEPPSLTQLVNNRLFEPRLLPIVKQFLL